ncbi:MAG: bacillithiol biosynthesis cysteine-adding enzyme BshC, partial [Chitinophagaceae bacterium]
MKTTGLETLIQRVAGELGVLPHGPQLIKGLQEAYGGKNTDLQTGTFRFLHHLFGAFGLVVLIPDHARLKSLLKSICEDDLFRQTPYTVVQQTVQQLQENYEVQARPRPINLFYLHEQIRNRIEQKGDHYVVVDTSLQFSKEELKQELNAHPERFSPNVILRGLFQEMILPNVATIGGGGELAYWLELKGLFDHYRVPYPVVVLRNSFLLVPQAISSRMAKLELSSKDFFQSPESLLKQIAQRESGARLQLEEEKVTSRAFYDALKKKSRQIDPTLEKHVDALGARALNRLEELEKKMIRSEKKKYEWERDQITQIKAALFPGNGLQERTENFMPYYARYGPAFLEQLLQHSLTLEQQFQIWELPESATGKS